MPHTKRKSGADEAAAAAGTAADTAAATAESNKKHAADAKAATADTKSIAASTGSINPATHPAPMHFGDWIAANASAFQPPVNNKLINGLGCQFKVMVVGGPNTRTDYHINRGEEWFYMVKGDMILKVCDGGRFVDVVIREGECFCLPGGIPHSPQRYLQTYGLVLEHDRYSGENDGLRWYCPNPTCRVANTIVYEEYFVCQDLGTQLKEKITAYYSDEKKRTCKTCGTIDQKVPILAVDEAIQKAEANNKIAEAQAINPKLPHINPLHHPKPFPLRTRLDAAIAKAKAAAAASAGGGGGGGAVEVIHSQEWKVAAFASAFGTAGGTTQHHPTAPSTTTAAAAAGASKPNDIVLHTAATEEWVWQFDGTVTVTVLDGGALRRSDVKAGEIYLVPAGIPHAYSSTSASGGVSCGVIVTLTRDPSNAAKDSVAVYDSAHPSAPPRAIANAHDPVLHAMTAAAK